MAAKKTETGAAIGAGAAALAAAAAAGYYFYATKNAKKHRQSASKWAKGLQRDVKKNVKSLKKIDAKTVARVVDDAAAAYQGMRGVAAGDVRAAAAELKNNWQRIRTELEPAPRKKRPAKKKAPKKKRAAKKRSS